MNTFAVFTDHFWQLTKPMGYAGLIIPTGLVSGFTYRAFLAELLLTKSLVAFYGFENEDLIFPHITNKVKFGLLTMAGRATSWSSNRGSRHISDSRQKFLTQKSGMLLPSARSERLTRTPLTFQLFGGLGTQRLRPPSIWPLQF